MSHPARLLLRAPPHLPFIQGYPGIPASPPDRKAAGVHGSLELRIITTPVKAKWVRVEIRKYESLPPGFPSSGNGGNNNNEPLWEHIGEIQTLWKPSDQNKEFDLIETSDFKFYLPLPENIPSSIELPRSTGIRYELVAALCYKTKGGLFKKESQNILKISEPLNIIKHELHSTWPIYNLPSEKTMKFSNDQLILNVLRPNSSFSSGDKIEFIANLKSLKSQPFKLKGFECTINEIITSIPLSPENNNAKGGGGGSKKKKSLQTPISKSKPISIVKAIVDERIALGGEKSAKIEMLLERVLVTIKNARILKVEYELQVKAVLDGIRDKVEIGGIMYTVGVFGRNTAEQAIREIGRVDELCPNIPQPSPPPPPVDPTPFAGSQPDLPPNARMSNSPYLPSNYPPQRPNQPPLQQPASPQNFDPRQTYHRQSSNISDSTFNTTNTGANDFGMTPTQNRPYATMPLSSGQGQLRQDVMFPNPQPLQSQRPRSITPTPTSPTIESSGGHDRYVQSDVGHDTVSNRYSTATMATFGRWDKGLKNAMGSGQQDDATIAGMPTRENAVTPTTPTIPSPSTRQSSPMTTGPSPSGSARPPIPPNSFYMTAEQEKILQRERYEAAKNLAGSGQGSSNQGLKKNVDEEIPEAPPPEYAPPVPAQPKKQYTAPSRPVSEYTSNSPSNPNSPRNSISPRLHSPPPRSITPTANVNRVASPPLQSNRNGSPSPVDTNQAYLTAAEEKEIQRRRYEEATSRTFKRLSLESNSQAESSGSGLDIKRTSLSPKRESSIIQQLKSSPPLLPRSGSTEGPIPYNAIFPPGRKSSIIENTPNPIGLGISNNVGVGENRLSEKEQMKRYYQAQEAVAQAQSNPNSPKLINVGNSSSLSKKTGGGSIGSINPHFNDNVAGPSGVNNINAVDEKEQMRRYYEAQDRVASASGNGIAEGSGSNLSPVKPQFGNTQSSSSSSYNTGNRIPSNSIDEKEQMRRYYEAQDKVNAASRGEGSDNTRERTSPTKPPQANNLSAIDEKEQMRRYYEAQDRVNAANRGEGSGGNVQQSAPTSPTKSPQPANSSAINEKEQMRRYYEAQDRVARASQSPGPGSSSAGPSNSNSYSTPTSSPIKQRNISSVPPPLSQKEQMKRYYEAQDKVAQANQGSSSSPQYTPTTAQAKAQSSPAPPPNIASGSKPGTSVINAIDEKEQMRRYYEAMDRVNHASGSGSGSGSGFGSGSGAGIPQTTTRQDREVSSSPTPPPILAPPVDSPSTFDDLPPSISNGINNSGSYSSAEQEKELMRKRYEQATSAVERHASPPPPSFNEQGTSKNQPRTSLGLASEQILDNNPSYTSGSNTNHMEQRSLSRNTNKYDITSPPDSPLIHRDPTIKAGKAKASFNSNATAGGGAPPPPLPARPPKEYVELLSPVV